MRGVLVAALVVHQPAQPLAPRASRDMTVPTECRAPRQSRRSSALQAHQQHHLTLLDEAGSAPVRSPSCPITPGPTGRCRGSPARGGRRDLRRRPSMQVVQDREQPHLRGLSPCATLQARQGPFQGIWLRSSASPSSPSSARAHSSRGISAAPLPGETPSLISLGAPSTAQTLGRPSLFRQAAQNKVRAGSVYRSQSRSILILRGCREIRAGTGAGTGFGSPRAPQAVRPTAAYVEETRCFE